MSTIPQRSSTPSGAAYAATGAGEPLLLIHGVGMRLEAWTPQIAALSARHRVVAVDLPGHGHSAPLARGATLTDFVGWCTTFIREAGLGPVNVAGHSMGALIAGGLAAEAPQLVRRVALLNGVHRRDQSARDAVIGRAGEILTGHFDREAPLKRWFGSSHAPGHDLGHDHETSYRLCRDLLMAVDAAGYATAYQAFATGDGLYADRWPQIRCPALFLTGDGDLNSTAEMAEAMAAQAPRGKAVIIRGHRHMVNLTAPAAVNAALEAWLGEAEAPSTAETLAGDIR